MNHWNGWSIWWLFWLIQFAVAEGYALATNTYNTLSWQVWRAEGTGATFVRYMVAALCIWLFLHFVFHLFT